MLIKWIRPAYDALESNNVVGPFNEMKGHPWKESVEGHVNVRIVLEYLDSYVKAFDVERFIKFNTRVDTLTKNGDIWEVKFSTLVKEGLERGNVSRSTEVSLLIVIIIYLHFLTILYRNLMLL